MREKTLLCFNIHIHLILRPEIIITSSLISFLSTIGCLFPPFLLSLLCYLYVNGWIKMFWVCSILWTLETERIIKCFSAFHHVQTPLEHYLILFILNMMFALFPFSTYPAQNKLGKRIALHRHFRLCHAIFGVVSTFLLLLFHYS